MDVGSSDMRDGSHCVWLWFDGSNLRLSLAPGPKGLYRVPKKNERKIKKNEGVSIQFFASLPFLV